jgi:hypothetical protein
MTNDLQKLLPLRAKYFGLIVANDGFAMSHDEAELVVQAANAYPRLVEALRELAKRAEEVPLLYMPVMLHRAIDNADELLTELGESDE